MRAVIFGAGGMLGQTLAGELPQQGYTLAAAFKGRADGDIADAAVVEEALGRLRPEVVFNAAAWTDVDGAEDHQAEAFRANAQGPEILARACAAVGSRLVHYSTDFVFDGERATPYDESAPAVPLSVYGQSKLEGEVRARAACPQSFIVRVGCLYGHHGRNFPSTLLRRLRGGELIRADDERLVSPTWVVPVARVSAQLARTKGFGLCHATAQGETTWIEFARLMAELSRVKEPRLEGLSGSSLKLKAARPRRAVLVSRRLPLVGLAPLPPWQEQLRDYLQAEPAAGQGVG
jgi:dTDP-4-dehydrorhamnose reductase